MITLHPHNQKAYKAVIERFKSTNKAAVVQPTGTGKSYVLAAVAEHFKNVLVIGPNHFVLNQAKSICTNKIQTKTYSWISRQLEQHLPTQQDLIVFDECHRLGAPVWSKGCDTLLELNPQAKILALTATPMRFLEQRNIIEERFQDDLVSSMDLADAWNQDILLPPTYIKGLVDIDKTIQEYDERIQSGNLSEDKKEKALELIEKMKLDWRQSEGVPGIIKKYVPKTTKRVIVFGPSILMLENLKDTISNWFVTAGFKEPSVYTIHSQMPAKQQLNIMNKFSTSEGLQILCSVNMLNEGIHIPDTEVVMLLRSTASGNIYFQQIGRCMSTNNTKNPIILDLADSITNATMLHEIVEAHSTYTLSHKDKKPKELKKFGESFKLINTIESIESLSNIFYNLTKSHSIWTIEELKAEALKYKRRIDFKNSSAGAYSAALRMHIMDEICGHMENTHKFHRWTEEEIIKIGSSFQNASEFGKYQSWAYAWALKHKIINKIPFKNSRKIWNLEDIKIEASKYSSKKEFADKAFGAYTWALKHKVIDQLGFPNIVKLQQLQKKERHLKIASTCSNKSEVNKKYPSTARYLYINKLWDQVKFKEDNGTTA